MKAGEWQTIGSLTFVRAEPGFAYVSQTANGELKLGVGFGLVRGGEVHRNLSMICFVTPTIYPSQVFKEFVDLQHHARTTRWYLRHYLPSKGIIKYSERFRMESKDRQEVKVRIQLRWCVQDPVIWVKRKGQSLIAHIHLHLKDDIRNKS